MSRRPTKASADCRPNAPQPQRSNLASVVRAYKMRCRPYAAEELGSFASEKTLSGAIRRAGLAERPDGKRYSHQRRIPGSVLQHAQSSLQRAGLQRAKSFDDLHDRVYRALEPIYGIGQLMVYDTALRVGAKLGMAPTRVYLHAGTRQGARALGMNWRAQHLAVREFPRELRELEAHEIEDCLCIFADDLARFGAIRVGTSS